MHHDIQLKLVIPNVVLLLTLTIGFLFYYPGYYSLNTWNRNSVATNCTIKDHHIVNRTCKNNCNCTIVCQVDDVNYFCYDFCSTCYNTCYDGVINATYHAGKRIINRQYVVVSEKNSSELVGKILDTCYQVDFNTACYYNMHNVTDSRLHLISYANYYYISRYSVIFGLVFSASWFIALILISFYQKCIGVNLINKYGRLDASKAAPKV